MDTLRQDLRYAIRALMQSPGFAAVAVLTLALGIGANAAIFSVVEGVLLRPLPYPDPEEILALWEVDADGEEMHVTAPNFLDWREQSRSFEAMALHSSPSFGSPTTVLGGREATRAWATAVSDGFFDVLGVRPVLGRTFTAGELEDGGARGIIVGHRFWRHQLGSTPDLDGVVLNVWGEPRQVVGVMPPGFQYPSESELWLPVGSFEGQGRRAHNWAAVGRLAEGAGVEAARTELASITQRLSRVHGGDIDAVTARVTPLRDQLVGEVRQPIWLLLGAAGFVLLVACTNLASALLARGTARQRELAVRAALGADRGRLVRQLFTESALLALLGAGAGLIAAAWLLDALVVMGPSIPRLGDVSIDGRVLGFTLALAGLTALLFGLLPAFRATRVGPAGALREGGRGGSASHRRGPWGMLVGAEVALALLLLIGSGLLIKSFWTLLDVDPGFNTENVLTIDVALPPAEYPDDERMADYFRRFRQAVGTLPGSEAVGVINHLPLGGVTWNGSFAIEGGGETAGYPDYRIASPGYFDALGIPLVRGRLFTDGDRVGSPPVALVSRAAAERYWPHQDPIGQRIGDLANEPMRYRGEGEWLTIVGVVEDVRHGSLIEEPGPAIYVSALQRPARAANVVAAVRTSVPPATLIAPIRERLRAVDPNVPIEFSTMSERVAESVAERRFAMLVLGLFAAIALLLAAVGIYGVVAYSVERRTREMGIRTALGATRGAVLRTVLEGSMRSVAGGLAVGLLGAVALTRLLRGLLYGVSPIDPAIFSAVAALLALVAAGATLIPAGRATRVDPMVALRNE